MIVLSKFMEKIKNMFLFVGRYESNLIQFDLLFNLIYYTDTMSQQVVKTSSSSIKDSLLLPPQSKPQQNQLSQFLSLFQNFVQSGGRVNIDPTKTYQVQVRDRQVTLPLPKIANGKIQESHLKEWIANVMKTVFSTAFNYVLKKDLTIEQAKIFCAENIFENIVALSQKYPLSDKDFKIIDEHVKTGVILYLRKKYPFTDAAEINKKLESALREVDNIQVLQNNYFTKSPILFQFKEDGNYNGVIMKVINDLMGIIDRQQKDQQSNYRQFVQLMSGIFEKVEDQDWMKNQQKQDKKPQEKPKVQQKLDNSRQQQKQKYKSSVKQYTSYVIGRKIPDSTSTYSKSQIDNGYISIENPTVLRILTKWCEELQDKYTGKYYSLRSESVKLQKGNIKTLLSQMRKAFDQGLKEQKKQIHSFMEELFKNNYEMQSTILKNQFQLKRSESLSHLQQISGKFSYKIVKTLHSYIIAYLNRLIHGLLKVAKDVFASKDWQDNQWNSPPNLISFTIGDLMRCKCSSKENQIIRLYKEIQRISKQNPSQLKIIRVKNRLKSQTNDILLNIRFKNSITCQIQLAIKSKASDFTKASSSFQHFLYQLQRSIFGPLTELCSIWHSLDRRAQTYRQLVKLDQQTRGSTYQGHTHSGRQDYSQPFLCSCCKRTYFHSNYPIKHQKCTEKQCKFKICVHCRIDQLTQDNLQQHFLQKQELKKACTDRIKISEEIPDFGVCVFLEANKPKHQIFTIINFQGDRYLLGKRDQNQTIYEVYRINSKAGQKSFKKKYLIFKANPTENYKKIEQNDARFKYILPEKIKQNFKKCKQSINLMNLQLSTQQCRTLLQLGKSHQKQAVRNLFLVQNKIQALPFDPDHFRNLQWINISNNKNLNNFTGLQLLKSLKRFTAKNCDIQTIHPSIYECQSLQYLNITNNKISQISDKVIWRSLYSAELQHNNISSISDKFFSTCTSIVSLDLRNNKLASIPPSISRLTKLEVLDYSFNQLTDVSDNIGHLQSLKELYLNDNKDLAKLPSSLKHKKLQIHDYRKTFKEEEATYS